MTKANRPKALQSESRVFRKLLIVAAVAAALHGCSKDPMSAANDYIKVGAAFDSYTFGGNTISFKVDRTFSREYGMEKAYCLCLDLTADSTGNEPPIQMFTLKGGDFITNKYPGVGGLDGLSSGIVSSPAFLRACNTSFMLILLFLAA